MLRMVLWRSVAVVAVCVATACDSSAARPADPPAGATTPSTAQATASATTTKAASPAVPATGGSGYSPALSMRLVTTDALPAGFTVEGIATTMPRDAGDQRPAADVPCSDMIPLLSGRRLTGTPSAMAAVTVSHDAEPGWPWVANEVLRTYADDGARRAMTDLRTFVGRCPTVVASSGDRYRYAVAPGPRLGDDSVHLSSHTSGAETLEWDSILVRTGTALVVVHEEGNRPGGDTHLTQLAEAALRTYQATGS
ncbi:hypothetical protein GCE86_10025 [Micromonospora terminaliae]|uniref:Sensor domain-containing protein n=1 Tax=Micromonospora terminaliae TaxID=1914461 RepID=A0AAJ3DJ41_9ACTN|nr:hypothetical protein [Micromonospora terminaliae]NES27888.1 hypothetical protein [Micromonospora terminaliae]QGL47339.1 hypothetical protein GCE86_10025 [Micromonospora terminaliae]